MADAKISALTSATTPLAGTEVVPVVQSSTTKKVAVSDLTSGRTVTVGRITATTNVGTPSSNSQFGYGATQGAVITGTGSTYDVQLQNKTNQNVASIPTGTRDLSLAAGNLVIGTSGKGIDFSATPGTGTSELLADYEEGTWTPVPADASSGGNTGTAGSAYGVYTKTGDVVFITGLLVNVNTAGMTAGNTFYIQGLPFTSKDIVGATAYYLAGGVLTSLVTISSPVSTYVQDNGFSAMAFFDSAGAIIVSDITSGTGDFYFSLTYKAN